MPHREQFDSSSHRIDLFAPTRERESTLPSQQVKPQFSKEGRRACFTARYGSTTIFHRSAILTPIRARAGGPIVRTGVRATS